MGNEHDSLAVVQTSRTEEIWSNHILQFEYNFLSFAWD